MSGEGFESVLVSYGLGFSMVYSHSAEKVQFENPFSYTFTTLRLATFLHNSALSNPFERFCILTDFPQTVCRLHRISLLAKACKPRKLSTTLLSSPTFSMENLSENSKKNNWSSFPHLSAFGFYHNSFWTDSKSDKRRLLQQLYTARFRLTI